MKEGKEKGHGPEDGGVKHFVWTAPPPIEIVSAERASVIADHDAIGIQHWDDLEGRRSQKHETRRYTVKHQQIICA